MNRTAYPTELCRTIYDDSTFHSLSFALEDFVHERLVEMSNDEHVV